MTQEEKNEWREQRTRELEARRERRAPKRQHRAEIREVSEQFAQADDPPADNPPWEDPEPQDPGEVPLLPPDDIDEADDPGEDAELLRAQPVRRTRKRRAAAPPVDRDTFLSALSLETRALLSDEDIDEILAEEKKRAEDEQKTAARVRAREEIRHRMRVEHGLLSAETLRTRAQNERLKTKVRIRFDLPGDGAGHQGSNGMRIDGRLLAVRTWHTVSVAELESIREMHYNAWVNETQFKTLDQASRFGITTMNRLQGTTPARAIFAQQPNQVEVADVAD